MRRWVTLGVLPSRRKLAGVDFAYLRPGAGLRGLSCPYMRYMADPQQDQVTNLHLSMSFTFSAIIHTAIHLGSLHLEPFGWEEHIHHICFIIYLLYIHLVQQKQAQAE